MYICESLARLYLQRLYTYKYFHDVTLSLQTYILSWIRIDFCGTRLRS
jgi:hypothetical protein